MGSTSNISFLTYAEGDDGGGGIHQLDFNFSAWSPESSAGVYNHSGYVIPAAGPGAHVNSTVLGFPLGTLPPCTDWNDTTVCNDSVSALNATEAGETVDLTPYTTWQLVLLATLAGSTSLVTILGNIVVIMSFVLERTIRQPTNYFIASLAVSDLLIGTFSMPFYTVYLLRGKYWPLGEVLCDLWLSLDYTVCLTSIYTVFCITIDRFCSVKIPAKYRGWRTERKVNVIIAFTWVVPVVVFFTSIYGWQYFVGKRTVGEGMCYVQYMEDAIFNCILQVGYFWVTLVVMCILYTGIYKVALDLQRKSEAKHKKMTSLVSMAGQTMTKIGIGMSKQHQANEKNNKVYTPNPSQPTADGATLSTQVASNTTCFTNNTSEKHNARPPSVGEDERSSSPAFPSDTEPSSQSPKRTKPPNDAKDRHKASKHKKHSKSAELRVPGKAGKTGKGHHHHKGHRANGRQGNCVGLVDHVAEVKANSVGHVTTSTVLPPSMSPTTVLPPGGADLGDVPEEVENLPPPMEPVPVAMSIPDSTAVCTQDTEEGEIDVLEENEEDWPPPPDYSCVMGEDAYTAPTDNSSIGISSPPEMIRGVKYIDQDSLKSPQSNDNMLFLEAPPGGSCRNNGAICEEPQSPVWKKRSSFIEKEFGEADDVQQQVKSCTGNSYDNLACNLNITEDSNQNVEDKTRMMDSLALPPAAINIQVETMDDESRTVSKLAKPDDIQPLNGDGSKTIKRRSKTKSSPLRSIVKSVSGRKSKRGRSKKEKQKSKSENRARKALRTITIILGAFIFCWTPWHILSMIMGFCSHPAGCFHPVLYDISYWLCYLNSPINPLCYAFANQQFKRTFIRILKFDWHRT